MKHRGGVWSGASQGDPSTLNRKMKKLHTVSGFRIQDSWILVSIVLNDLFHFLLKNQCNTCAQTQLFPAALRAAQYIVTGSPKFRGGASCRLIYSYKLQKTGQSRKSQIPNQCVVLFSFFDSNSQPGLGGPAHSPQNWTPPLPCPPSQNASFTSGGGNDVRTSVCSTNGIAP